MDSDYYDIDSILADSEKVPCRFNITVPGLGYLEDTPGKPLQKHTKIEIPFWLAEVLAVSGILDETDTSFVDLLEPEFSSSKVINAIKTDPVNVDLRNIKPNYYKLIQKWCGLFQDSQTIEVIMQMLKERAFEINNYANNAHKFNNNFIGTLDEFERNLLKQTAENHKQMRQWVNE